jgi:hypothetical protein
MSAGTRSKAMTATAPASSARRACNVLAGVQAFGQPINEAPPVPPIPHYGGAYLLSVYDIHNDTSLEHSGQSALDSETSSTGVTDGAIANDREFSRH